MNKVILMGRLTRDADVRATNDLKVARCTLAVDRRVARNTTDNTREADFIACVAFGKRAEFLERFGKQGTKFIVEGRIQTGSYTNREGNKVYTTDVIIENIEFAESKAAKTTAPAADDEGFMSVPDGIEEELPFS